MLYKDSWYSVTEEDIFSPDDQTAEDINHVNQRRGILREGSELRALSPEIYLQSCNKHGTVLQGQWQSIWDEDIILVSIERKD